MLLVKFKTPLSREELQRVIDSRIDEFRALEGLSQKYYLHNTDTGEVAGLYLWDSAQALADYRESELRGTIARAYQAASEPQIEVFTVLDVLRDEDA